MSVTDYELRFFSSEDNGASAVAGDAEVTFDFGTSTVTQGPSPLKRKKVILERVDVYRSAGVSATNTDVAVADASGASTTDYSVKWLNAATAPGTRVHETNIDLPLYTDTTGKLYMKVNGDAADTFKYTVAFRIAK